MAAKKTKALAKIEKKILITGGTGFLGTHIVRQFLDAGEKNLRVMASSVPNWMKDAAQMNKIHVEGTRLLCEAAKEAGVKTFLLASSSGTIAVGETDEVLDETYPTPLAIISRWAYYASKFYQEKTALENFNEKGTKLVILNPSLLLGTDDERLSSTKVVLDFMARKIPYTPSGGLNFVDARDAATGFINALEKGRHQEKYLLGAANMNFKEFFGRLERLSGVSAPVLRVPKKLAMAGSNFIDSIYKNWNKTSPIAPKEVEQAEYFWYFASTKAEEELNFTPRDAQETLQNTISYLRENFLWEGVFK